MFIFIVIATENQREKDMATLAVISREQVRMAATNYCIDSAVNVGCALILGFSVLT